MLSAFSSLSGLGGGSLAAAAISKGVTNVKIPTLASSTQQKINWEEYNWPTTLEVAGLSFGVIHCDLSELKEKRDAAVYSLTLNSYRWFQFTMCLCLLNFVDSIVLSAVAKSAYPGINVLFSLIWALIWAPSAMAVVYHIYKGFADNSTMAKMIAKVGAACIVILLFIMVLGAFGNINGFVSLGSDRIKAVALSGDGGGGGAAQLWTAICVIESLLWMSNAACFGYISSQLFSGSLSETNTATTLS